MQEVIDKSMNMQKKIDKRQESSELEEERRLQQNKKIIEM